MMISPSTVLAYAGLQALIHYGAGSPKGRQWGLSACNATLMSLYGLLTTFHWLTTHDLTATAYTDNILYKLQAYLVVDLIYNGFVNREVRQNILEFWVHHSVYAVFASAIIASGMSGAVAPYMILEIPAALRSWGTLIPEWRTDAGFGLSFFGLRVVTPFIFLARDYAIYPTYFFVAFVGMQSMHFYWLYLWCRSQLPRLLDTALAGSGGSATV